MNPRLLTLLAVLLASPAVASTQARLHLITADDAAPSTVPLLAGEAAALPFSFHLPPLRLATDLPLPLPALPGPVDHGGGAGVSGDIIPVLAILLSLFIGFGLGHLLIRDRDGFILFLIVDIVIWAVTSVIGFSIFPLAGPIGLGGLAVLISHIIQVLDVYSKSFGGGKLLDRARQDALVLAPPPGGPELALPATTRMFALSF